MLIVTEMQNNIEEKVQEKKTPRTLTDFYNKKNIFN